MTDDEGFEEFARIFRCTPDMAPTYVARIHERMGREIPMSRIIAAMKHIAPKRLSMSAIVDRLAKMERTAARARTRSGSPAGEPEAASTAHKTVSTGSTPKPGALTQIAHILAANWERGRRHGLKPPAMTAAKFVQRAQSLAGTPRPTVARVLEAMQKLDRRDVLLTPNLVADEINESQ